MQNISHFKIIILLVSLFLIVGMKKVSLYVKPMADLEYQQQLMKINTKIEELKTTHAPSPTPTNQKRKKRKSHN